MGVKQQFIMMIGIPGSGKSYIADQMKEDAKKEDVNIAIHSSDAIREEMFGDVNDQDHNAEVFEELHSRVDIDLGNGRTVIYDATNLNKKRRISYLKSLKRFKCAKTCVLVLSTLEDCIERNNTRDRNVPNDVIERMYKNFQPPSLEEGWDNIVLLYNVLDEENTLTYNLDDFFYGKINACEIDQENEHHTKTIGYHSLAVYDYLKEHEPNDIILQIAGLLHDCGKPFTKTNITPDGEVDTQYHYYNHHCVGAYDSFFYTMSMNLPMFDRITVANLIYFHMMPFAWKQNHVKEKWKKKLGEVFFERIMKLHEADEASS